MVGHRVLLMLFCLLLCVQEAIKFSHTFFPFIICLCGAFLILHSALDLFMHTLSNNSSVLQAKIFWVDLACSMLLVGLLPFPPWGYAATAWAVNTSLKVDYILPFMIYWAGAGPAETRITFHLAEHRAGHCRQCCLPGDCLENKIRQVWLWQLNCSSKQPNLWTEEFLATASHII